MASVKVKFRSSKVEGKKGVIFYQIIHGSVVRHISTGFRIFASEWDKEIGKIASPKLGAERAAELTIIKERIKHDEARLNQIILMFIKQGECFTVDDLVCSFKNEINGQDFCAFTLTVIERQRELRRYRCVETYITTLNSFMRFRKGVNVLLVDINSDLMISYEAYLKHEGLSMNTISFYMRILRAIYNRAVEDELVEQCYPFKKVYTGVDKTIKRAIHIKYIKKLKKLDLSVNSEDAFVRDMFLFSFYTRGMSFVDMAFLRKKDVKGVILTYRRRKTGQQLKIKWERCMQEIVERYKVSDSPYMLPIIKSGVVSERNEYRNALARLNKRLKELGRQIGLNEPLTMYVARHSWASVAKNNNIPISVISEGMGHDSEATTQIYLASLDTSIVDKANNMILKLL